MASHEDIPIGAFISDNESGEFDMKKMFDDLEELDEAKLPPELQKKDIEKLKKIHRNAKSLTILVTGKTGAGKSTMTNGILGVKVKDKGAAKESSDVSKGCTTVLQSYHTKKGNIDITVWDSPGLQDGTENQKKYLKQMKTQCSKRDLTLYCIKMAETRFVSGDDNPDVLAMKKYTQTFGNVFWSNTIIILTFANVLEAFNVDWEDFSEEEKAEAFQALIKQWGDQLINILIHDIKVPEEIVRTIPIVPAGHYRKPHLPGCKYWLSTLWFHCVDTIPTPEVRVALVTINASRLKSEKEVKENDFKKPPEEQPIVLTDKTIKDLKYTGKIAAGAAVGAGIGSVIGLLGIFGGPLAAATIAAGAAFGGACGAAFAAIYLEQVKNRST